MCMRGTDRRSWGLLRIRAGASRLSTRASSSEAGEWLARLCLHAPGLSPLTGRAPAATALASFALGASRCREPRGHHIEDTQRLKRDGQSRQQLRGREHG